MFKPAGVADRFDGLLQDITHRPSPARHGRDDRPRPLYVVVLAPRADVVQARDHARQRARGKVAHKPGDHSVAEIDAVFRREAPRIGLWLDTSAQTVTETVEEILGRFRAEAEVRTPPRARTAADGITNRPE